MSKRTLHSIIVLALLCFLLVLNQSVCAAAPTVISVSPANGPTGGGTTVTISGTGLGNPTEILFGLKPAAILSSSDTQIIATTPAQVTGVVSVAVTTSAGTGSKSNAFTYAVPYYAPVFASWPASTPQEDGGVPSFSTGGSEALAVLGENYVYHVVISGNPAPTTINLNNAPAGMVWTPNASPVSYAITGTITWTPTTAGLHNVTISATNSQGSTQQSFKLRAIPIPASSVIDGKSTQNPALPIKIMCLGDSITVGGFQNVGSYRETLFRMLGEMNYQVNAVGSSGENTYKSPGSTVNTSHEGHGGWSAYSASFYHYHSLTGLIDGTTDLNDETSNPGIISNTVITDNQPDIVVVMAGTNDVSKGPYVNNGVAREPYEEDLLAQDHMRRLIDAIWQAKPSTRIVVLPILHNIAGSQFTPRIAAQDRWNIGAAIEQDGVTIARSQTGTANLVTNYQQAGKPITFIDANRMAMFPAGWDPTGVDGLPSGMAGDRDGVHPGAAAYQNAIAQAAFRGVLDITEGALDSSVVPSPPSGLRAVATASGLDVTWSNNSLNAEFFDLDWALNADFTDAITTEFSAGNSAVVLTGPPPNSQVYLRVRARNAGGASWYSPPIQMNTFQIAMTGTWTNPAGGFWSTASNWQNNVIAGGPGGSADFSTIDPSGDTVVTLSSPHVIENLIFGDINTTSAASWLVANHGNYANALNFAGTAPTITVNALGTDKKATIGAKITGTKGLRKAGPGTLALSNSNTYSGGTTIRTGTIIAQHNTSLGSGTVTLVDGSSGSTDEFGLLTAGAVNLSNNINSYNYGKTGLSIIGGSTADASSFSGVINLDKDTEFSAVTGGVVTFSGIIKYQYGPGNMIKTGTGTVIFSGLNTYTGTTTLNAGILRANDGVGLPVTSYLSFNGGVLETSGSFTRTLGTSGGTVGWVGSASGGSGGGFSANGGPLTINLGGASAQVTFSSAGGANLFGTLKFGSATATHQVVFQNPISLNGAGRTVEATPGEVGAFVTSAELTGVISGGSSTGALTKTGSGTLILSGANTYENRTIICGGLLVANCSQNGTTSGPLGKGLVTGISGIGEIRFSGGTLGFTTASSAWDPSSRIAVTTSTSAVSIDTGGQNITFGSALTSSQSGGLIKIGSGALILNASNAYMGTTSVANGILALGISGSIPSSSSVIIAANAKLDVTARTSYTLPATLTLGLDSSGSSGQIDATGKTLVISGASVTFIVSGDLTATSYVLATYGSKTGSAFASVIPPSGYVIDYAYNGGTQIALVQPTDFSSWINGSGLSESNKHPMADSNHDGINNLLEYALNGIANSNNNTILPTIDVTTNNFVFTYSRRDISVADTTQTFQYSGDLVNWSDIVIPTGPGISNPGITTVTVTDAGTADTIMVSIPKSVAPGGKILGRLKVTLP